MTGDTVVVPRIDRLARNLTEGLKTIEELHDKGINIRSLTERLDTGDDSPTSRLMLHMLLSLAEWERDTIRDRIRAGVDRAAAEGRTRGRPPALSSEKVEAVKSFLGNCWSVSAAARTFGVSRPTVPAISRSRTPCPLWLRGCRPAAHLLLEGPRSVGPAALARGVHRADAELPAIGMGRSFVPERILPERLFGGHSL